jgi:hypothetical protein
MKKQALILILIFLIIFTSLARIGIKDANRASINLTGPGAIATATSTAIEFHVQLTLTAGEAAFGLANQTP